MTTLGVQLPLLSLSALETMQYFVPHSGVLHAHSALVRMVEDLSQNSSRFFAAYLCGPKGSGKTHLLRAVVHELQRRSFSPEKILLVDFDSELSEQDDAAVSAFVSRFEVLLRNGGIALFASRKLPREVSSNPHITSRLLVGEVLQMEYPNEEELRPLAEALLEQRNLKVSDRSMEYLLRRLPADPLSLAGIFDRINELSFQESRPARLGLIKKVLVSGAPKVPDVV